MSVQELTDGFVGKFISRKLLVFAIGTVALYTGNLPSSEWLILSCAYISVQGFETVLGNKYNNNNNQTKE
jgi:hypothetical protein